MSGLHVDAGTMNAQGMNTISAAHDLQNQIGNLNAKVEGLMMIWRGPSAQEFKTAFDQQLNNLRSFQELLNELGERITAGARKFDQNEEENIARASGLFN